MDAILKNGKIYLGRGSFAGSLLIHDGLVAEVWQENEPPCEVPGASVIDLEGKTVLPGLIDSHLHMYNTGVSLTSVKLYGADSIEECVRRGREFIRQNDPPKGSVILGRGWNDDYFTDERRMLTRHDLDRISTEYPIIFTRACGHTLAANTLAVEMAGVTSGTPQPEGGRIELGEDGKPNGVFKEHAMGLIQSLSAAPTVEEIKRLLLAAMEHAAENGITSVQTNDMNEINYPALWQAYEELKNEGRALTRVYQQCIFSTPSGLQDFIDKGYKTGFGDDMNKIGPLKLLIDGSLGARTALMRKDYSDMPGTRGILCVTPEELDAFMDICQKNNMQAVVHAIGDRAIEIVLDAYEKVIPNGNNSLRHGIVHCQITDKALLSRFAANGVCALVQPIFLHYDMHIAESRVGSELASTSYAFGTMDKLGLHVSYGTDSPVEDLNTMNNIYCAVTRKDLSGYPEKGWLPDERVSVEKAVDHYTADSAYNSFEEDKKGMLLPGYMADLAVLSDDIFTVKPEDIKNIKVLMTMLGGNITYKA